MNKMLAMMLLLSLTTVACKKSGSGSAAEESAQTVTEGTNDAPVDGPAPAPAPGNNSTVPALALSFSTNVELMSGFTQSREEKYNAAVAMTKKVVATEAFRKAVLNHKYNGVKSFANTTKSNAAVYQSILDAAEKLQPAKNNTMDVGVKMYYEDNSVVGWTNGSITYFNVNRKFFDNYDINEVAGNLMHEWLHKLNYGHDSSATARRPYSVPYAVGYMIRSIGKNFL